SAVSPIARLVRATFQRRDSRMQPGNVRSGLAAVVTASIVLLSGCPTTRQTRTVEESGFLRDYSQLREGGTGEAQLVYLKPGGARVALNTVSKIVPQLRLLTTVGGLATDTQLLVGRAGVEAEILDGVTDERLAAAVDRRAGTKALRGGVSTWSDVENAFDYWSERL